MKNPTVEQIVKEYLKKNGYDGLCGDDCGCEIDDLAPCGCEIGHECVAGYKVIVTQEHEKTCECCQEFGPMEWHMTTKKPRKRGKK